MSITKEEIIEGNKLIARFMGYEYFPFNENEKQLKPGWWKVDSNRERTDRKLSRNGYLCRKHDELRYWNEWNWLMPVVEKIIRQHESSCYFCAPGYLSSSPDMFHFGMLDDTNVTETSEGNSMIEAAWRAVVSFIKSFNKNLERTVI
jgi:hypothetical protein